MPDNLTISIGADTSKARGDLKLLQAELKNVDRQINAAVKTGDTARAKELANTFGTMKDKAVALDRSLKDLGRDGSRAFNDVSQAAKRADASVNVTARSTGRLFRQLRSLRGIGGISGSLIGGGIGGAAGFTATSAISELIRQFDEIAKSMREIRDLARESGAKPLMVQGMQELAKESGESAEAANKFLSGVSSTIARVATTTKDATKSATQNFATFGDKTVQVMRGAEKPVRDFSDALAILQVDEDRLRKLPFAAQVQALGAAFQRAEKNAKQLGLSEIQLNEISKNVFGVPAEQADKLITAYANIDKKTQELAASQRGATKKTLDDIDASAGAWEKLSQQIQETWAAITKNTAQAQGGLANLIRKFLSDLPSGLLQALTGGRAGATQAEGGIWAPVFKPLKEEANTLPSFFRELWKKIQENNKEPLMLDPATQYFKPTKDEANTLIPFFEGLTTSLGGIWKGFWGLFIGEAKAATGEVKKSMAQIKADADQAATGVKAATTTAPATKVLPATAGQPSGMTAAGVYVGRGPGRQPNDPYGPPISAGPGLPSQTENTGFGTYQAAPPKMISPMATGTYGTQAVKSAAEASADAAAASKSAAEASALATQAIVNPSFRYAEGGMVHGPGTPTSDSVTARLSAGEFVMRAAAVQRWGPSFMAALNGMSSGMPSRGVPRFASGGMVTGGGGGATVNLMFPGGNSFALRGDAAVVGALTREARRAGMLNAGGVPGAFA